MLEFFNPKTRAYLKTGTYKLYPQHSKVPSISEADRTLLVAQEMLQKLQIATSKQATEKLQHNQALQQLREILRQSEPPQRVGANQAAARSPCTPQRVQAPRQQRHPQRIDAKYNTTADPTDPEKVRAMRYVDQKRTRANKHPIGESLPTIWEEAQTPRQAPTSGSIAHGQQEK